MAWLVNELYLSEQGEGALSGRPAVFCRFNSCNLWSGRESDRLSAVCRFCDTDFASLNGDGGGRYRNARALALAAHRCWRSEPRWRRRRQPPASLKPLVNHQPYIICTGGEPLLQLNAELVEAFHKIGFQVGLETNGTLSPPPGVDWITVSPKAGARWRLKSGDELKIVWPQPGFDLKSCAEMAFKHFFLQPMDGPGALRHLAAAMACCARDRRWRLSLQTHKLRGLR